MSERPAHHLTILLTGIVLFALIAGFWLGGLPNLFRQNKKTDPLISTLKDEWQDIFEKMAIAEEAVEVRQKEQADAATHTQEATALSAELDALLDEHLSASATPRTPNTTNTSSTIFSN